MGIGDLYRLTARRLKLYTFIAACVWSLVYISFLLHDYLRERQRSWDIALAEARALVQRDRQWIAAACGMMYVPATSFSGKRNANVGPDTLIASDGSILHRVNSVLLVNMLNQTQDPTARVLMHLSGTQPLLGADAGDTWKQGALSRIRRGETEVAEEYHSSDGTFLRLMAPVAAESSCLSCHGQRVGAEGNLLGAVNVTVPITGTLSSDDKHMVSDALRFTALWLGGMVVLFLIHSRAKRRLADRTRAEAAIKDANDRYDRIVSTGHVGIWELDEHANTSFVNQRMAAMLGYTTDEMLGRPMFDFMEDEEKAQAARNFERRKQRIEEQHEFRFRRKDGTPLWALVSTRVILDETGGFNGALGIITDITDRKRIEEDLRTSEGLLRTLVESTDDIITMQDLEGRYLYFNAPAKRYGVTETDIVQRMPEELFDPETANRIMEHLRKVTVTGEPLEYELRIPWRGEELWLQRRLYPIRDASGRVTAVSTFSQNITKQKQIQEKLRETQERLKIETVRARIAADLHDDIGSTLSSTSIFAAMLRRQKPEMKDRADGLLTRIEKNLENVQESLHDIVWTINPENDDLEDLTLRLQDHARELADAQGIVLQLDVLEGDQSLRVPMQIRRFVYLVFKEALNNVVTHSRCSELKISLSVIDRMLRIGIADNGIGFDVDKAARGNGIVNMQNRVRLMGGTFEIHSTKGEGTVVTLRVPIA